MPIQGVAVTALTPSAHRLFDAVRWTIDDNLPRIQVAKSDIAELIRPSGSHFKPAGLNGRRFCFVMSPA
jgi:hypothetical protein